jgi:hypothetical protein
MTNTNEDHRLALADCPFCGSKIRRRALSFLRYGSLVRRSGGWRFGADRIPDAIVERILARGRAVRDGDQVWLAVAEAAE